MHSVITSLTLQIRRLPHAGGFGHWGIYRELLSFPHGMPAVAAGVEIPKRAWFKAGEVCDLVRFQAYVLRSWEAEFPDLGVAKTAGGPRVYRRTDVEQVL